MEKQKIDVRDLKIGMYVTKLDRPWLETSFSFQGFPIRTAYEISALQKECRFVYIDIEKTSEWEKKLKAKPHSTTSQLETKKVDFKFKTGNPDLEEKVSFQNELSIAVDIYESAHQYIKGLWEDARLGRSVDAGEALKLADRMVHSIIQNENALIWLSQLKNRDEYTTQHSLNVSIFSILFGRHLGLPERQMRTLGYGALLHDIGKMRVPLEILNKPGRLTDKELALLKKHPEYGRDILSEGEGIPSSVIDIVYSHHERIDGSGYPQGLMGEEISRNVYIVAIADVYDAETSDRSYRMGISPHEALSLMYGLMPQTFPSELVEEFIRCLGIYPVGSVVELDSGEVCVVMTVNRRMSLRPLLVMVLDRNKQPLPAYKMLDIEIHAQAGSDVKIKKILQPDSYGIDVKKVIKGYTSTLLRS